jgi:uncharacterized protein YciI
MALFALLCTDKPDSLELRLATRPTHLDYLTGLGATLKLAGPTLDGDDKPNGSLLIVEADDIAAARALADNDPYAKAGLFASVEVKPWRQVFGKFA